MAVLFLGARIAPVPVLASAAVPVDTSPVATTEPLLPAAPIEVNEFIPDDENLSDCLGLLERPGCGSAERGGWRQTTVFVVMIAGLTAVFGRIAYGVHRNRERPPPEPG